MKHLLFIVGLVALVYCGYKKMNPDLPPDEVVEAEHYRLLVGSLSGQNYVTTQFLEKPERGKWIDTYFREPVGDHNIVGPYQIRVIAFNVKRLPTQDWNDKGREVVGYPVDVIFKLEREYELGKIRKEPDGARIAQMIEKKLPREETQVKRLIYFLGEDGKTWRSAERKT